MTATLSPDTDTDTSLDVDLSDASSLDRPWQTVVCPCALVVPIAAAKRL